MKVFLWWPNRNPALFFESKVSLDILDLLTARLIMEEDKVFPPHDKRMEKKKGKENEKTNSSRLDMIPTKDILGIASR